MQIMVEGLALAAFGFMHQLTPEPLLKQLLRYVMSDEARHVAFGVLSLKEYYAELTDAELRERQEFAFEAAVRMRDRFLQQEVWERIGVDPKEVIERSVAIARGRRSSRCCSRRSCRTARSSACSTPTTAGCATASPRSASSSSRTGPTPARSTKTSTSWPRTALLNPPPTQIGALFGHMVSKETPISFELVALFLRLVHVDRYRDHDGVRSHS